jgi:hypothetical protein
MQPGRVKVISDGTKDGTKILDCAGAPLGKIKALSIYLGNGFPQVTATIEFYQPELDVEADITGPTVPGPPLEVY